MAHTQFDSPHRTSALSGWIAFVPIALFVGFVLIRSLV
jgi:hypothetical protein